MTEIQQTELKTDKVPVKKLNIREVLIKTIEVYKAGFKQYMILSMIVYIITICTTASSILRPYSTGGSLAASLIALAFIYITIKANVGIYQLTSNILQGRMLTAKEALRSANGLCGTYFGISLLYGLILTVPAIVIAISYSLIENNIVKWGMIALFAIPLVFLMIRYYFALSFGLLSGSRNGEFSKSKFLVAGDFWRVFIVVVITICMSVIIPSVLSAVIALKNTTMFGALIAAVVDAIFSILMSSIPSIAAVIMYYSLSKNKGMDDTQAQAEKIGTEKESISMQYERIEKQDDEI